MELMSLKTRAAKIKLESISSNTLKNFLKEKFKDLPENISTVDELIRKVNSKTLNSVTKFAENIDRMKGGKGKETLIQAIEDQAQSSGTKKTGLFNKLIYNKRECLKNAENFEKLKKAVKQFLLAKKFDKIDGDDANDLSEEEKNEHRTKHANIVAKLQSGRTSNKLKVFMAMVIWEYMKFVNTDNNQEKTSEQNTDPKPPQITEQEFSKLNKTFKKNLEKYQNGTLKNDLIKKLLEQIKQKNLEPDLSNSLMLLHHPPLSEYSVQIADLLNQLAPGISPILSFLDSLDEID